MENIKIIHRLERELSMDSKLPGMATRMGHLFHSKDQRSFIVAMDHGLVGALPGIENLPNTLAAVLEGGPDGILVSVGAFPSVASVIKGKTGIILTLDTYLTSSIPRASSMGEEHRLLSSVDQALSLGADAVKVFLIGAQNSLKGFADNVEKVAQVGNACFRWGIPLIVEPTLWGAQVSSEKKNDPELINHMCRIAYECGATILKIPYPGSETLQRISSELPCPVLIMGGSSVRSESEMLTLVNEIISAGAHGIVFGQNIWQRKEVTSIVRKVFTVVHS